MTILVSILKRAIPSPAARRSLRVLQASAKDTFRTLFREIRYGNRNRVPADRGEHLLVNVGCGDIAVKGWVNLDAGNPNDLRYYYNALNPLPFPANTVDHIHTEHFLEHLEYLDGKRFLHECFRVLRPEGTLRIIVPDLEKYSTAYCANEEAFFEQFIDLGGSKLPLETRALVCNQMYRMGGDHKFAWDFESLSFALRGAGFNLVERSSKDALEPQYSIDGQDWWREAESLYANARK